MYRGRENGLDGFSTMNSSLATYTINLLTIMRMPKVILHAVFLAKDDDDLDINKVSCLYLYESLLVFGQPLMS